MARFEVFLPGILPTFLRGRWGTAFATVLGAACDQVLDGAKDAVRAGLVYSAPVDALPPLLADASLEALPGETDDSKRARVAAAFDTWELAGTRPGLVLAIEQLGFSGYTLRTNAQWAPGLPPDGHTALWARWWLLLSTHPWSSTKWGDGTWGGGTWGSDATVAEVARVKRLLRAQSNARELGIVRVRFDSAGMWGVGTWGGGTWGSPGGTFIDWIAE